MQNDRRAPEAKGSSIPSENMPEMMRGISMDIPRISRTSPVYEKTERKFIIYNALKQI
jgi:hypothetical protein